MDQRAGFDRGADSTATAVLRWPFAQTGHRLPWDPGHRCSHDRFDHGHKKLGGGTTYAWGLSVVGLLIGAAVTGFLWRAPLQTPSCRPGCLAASICRAASCPSWSQIRDAGCADIVPIYLGCTLGGVATCVRSAHVANGDRPADHRPGRVSWSAGRSHCGRGDGADGGCVHADVADGRMDATAAAITLYLVVHKSARHRIVHAGARSSCRTRRLSKASAPASGVTFFQWSAPRWYRNIRCVVHRFWTEDSVPR